MIPDLPEEMSDRAILKFYDTLSGNLSDQSSVHTNWHTHRQNPHLCWICDQTTLLSKVLALTLGKYTKSTVDIQTNEVQADSDSVSEIENDNFDEENEPEFDVVDGEMESE